MSAALPSAPSDAARPEARSATWRLLHVGLTLAVCALAWWWLLRHADLGLLAASAGSVPAWGWLAAGAALLAGHGARARRLQRDWDHVGRASWWQCLRLVLAHNALVVMLPLRSGEAGYLWAVRRRWGVSWRAAGLALLRWRMQDAAILGVLAVALFAPLAAASRLALAAGAAMAVGAVLPYAWKRLVARAGAELGASPAGRNAWSGLGASAANWTLKVLANGGLLAVLAGLPATVAWRAALGGELAGVQPLQPPAGIGTYEAGLWFAAAQPGAAAPRIIAAALVVHAFSLAVALGAAALMQFAVPLRRAIGEPCP